MACALNCWPNGTGFSYYVEAPSGTEFSFRVIASGGGGHQISKELSGAVTNGGAQFYEPVFFTVMSVGVNDLVFELSANAADGRSRGTSDVPWQRQQHLREGASDQPESFSAADFTEFDDLNAYPYPYPYPYPHNL